MNDQTDLQLLRAYTEKRSESAFAELVRRHVDFVHSAAVRMVCDSHLAQDVTQGVFVALAKNAAHLTNRPVLSGWLHRTAQNIAAQTVRTDVRRRAREQEAVAMNELLSTEPEADWEHIAPQLDAALGELSEADRDALLLRYFERKSARAMAQTLGVSDEAAQKRVNRAVERLREFFAKRGVTVGASGLVVAISSHAVQAAPAGLAHTISTATAFAATTLVTTTASTATKAIIMTSLQKTLIAAVMVASVATPVVLHQRSSAKQRAADAALQQQSAQLIKQQTENERLSALAAQPGNSRNQSNDLVRLRNQAGALRTQTNALPKLQAENRRLKAAAALPEVEPSVPEKEQVMARMADNKKLLMASHIYARKNKGQFPTALDQVSPGSTEKATATPPTEQMEIVYQGSLTGMTNPPSVIVLKQKEPLPYGNRWAKVYGYGDGHVEMHIQPESDFTDWEKQHIPATLAQNP